MRGSPRALEPQLGCLVGWAPVVSALVGGVHHRPPTGGDVAAWGILGVMVVFAVLMAFVGTWVSPRRPSHPQSAAQGCSAALATIVTGPSLQDSTSM